MFKKLLFCALLLTVISSSPCAQGREIVITIDDLPFVGSANSAGNLRRENERLLKIIKTLIDHNIPVTGFVIAGAIAKNQWQLLEQFRDDGFLLGNHTYSHANLNRMTADKYIADVSRADNILTPLFDGHKYFRYPYLAESSGDKKQKVYKFLAEHHYVIAPVTIDSKDYRFNAQLLSIPWRKRPQNLEQIKRRYLAFIWNQTLRAEVSNKRHFSEEKPQILLVHANLLNSHFLGDVIDMYIKNGYKIISLDEAMRSFPSKPYTQVELPIAARISSQVKTIFMAMDRPES